MAQFPVNLLLLCAFKFEYLHAEKKQKGEEKIEKNKKKEQKVNRMANISWLKYIKLVRKLRNAMRFTYQMDFSRFYS